MSPLPEARFEQTIFHLDLRIQVMTPAALHALATQLARLGYSGLIIEWEATFPYRRHATISNAQAYSPAEVRAFLAHCAGLRLEVIPLQQCFGHVEYILRHPRYTHLREDERDRCQFCAREIDAARTLLRELLADLREFHPGGWIHLGGDETYLLGHCPACRAFADQHSLARLYTEFMNEMLREAKRAGFKPLVWADMLLKHPACLDLLPKDTVLIDWNYGWAPDRFGPPETLLQAGFEVWGAAALRSSPDNHSLTCWKRHFDNIAEFVPRALRTGYRNMVLTSWSTSGLYGYEWDDNWEALEILPMRRVYPLSGFSLLLAAFAAAVQSPSTFAAREFILRYSRARFGFGADEAASFARGLLRPHLKPAPELATLQPRRHRTEFAHLQLTAAFTAIHAAYRRIQARAQSPTFQRAHKPALARRLHTLLQASDELERTFRRLQRGYLAPAEIDADIRYRQLPLRNLLARLSR